MTVVAITGILNSVFHQRILNKFNWNTHNLFWCSGGDTVFSSFQLIAVASIVIWVFILIEKSEG